MTATSDPLCEHGWPASGCSSCAVPAFCADTLRQIAAEIRDEAVRGATTSRDFGRGVSWAATVIEDRARQVEGAP